MFNIKINKNLKDLIIISILVLATGATAAINIVLGIETVYTHLFYIPIILAGIWYHKKAVYVAMFLGIIHVLANFYLYNIFTYSPFVRMAIFIITAYAIGTIAEKKDEIFDMLKSSEEYLRVLYKVLEQNPNSIMITDGEGNITYLNSRCSRIIGHPLNEVIGKKADAVFRESATNTGETQPIVHQNGEHRRTYSDGSSHWILSSSLPLRDSDGNITHTVRIDEDVTERKTAEIALKESEEKYRQLINLAQEGILTINRDNVITFANPYIGTLLGYSQDKLVGNSIFDFVDNQSKSYFSAQVKSSDCTCPMDYVTFIARNGKRIFASMSISRITSDKDENILIMMADITDRIKKQELLNVSLKEKEALLKEIHHRVKNNLQVVSSLVNLQSGKISDVQAVKALNDTQARIKTMALIHEKMYRSTDLANIDLAEYIANLAKSLFDIYNAKQSMISLNLKLDQGLMIDIDTAVPCGLMINELVSNCLKHAFPDGRQGELKIELTRNGKMAILTVADNGVGLPPGFDSKNTGTLGLELVYTLIDQLEGNLTLKGDNGVTYKIEFPID